MSKPVFQVSEAPGAPCKACQIKEYRETNGQWPSAQAMNYWVMWGCCCSPESIPEKMAYMKWVSE
jgi:hypothetical protein